MRILIPTADYPPIEGGIGTVALQVSRELAALGHEVTVVAPHFPGMEAFDREEPAAVHRFRGYRLSWLRFFPMLAATWPLLRRTDLVLGINVAYGGVFGWMSRKPYVTFGYAYEFLKFRRTPLVCSLLRRIYFRSRLVVAISGFTRDKLIEFGVPESRIETIFPGAPAAQAVAQKEVAAIKEKLVLDEGRIVLAVGRLIPRKGHVNLVKALPRILEAVPDALVVMVGRGPCMPDVTKCAQELGVREHLRLPGRLSDAEVAALYAACDVFALPTGEDDRGQVEGFGLVFSEAHAYGKPVVAGRSGGVVDAVLDGETGIVVAPEDPDALAQAVVSLLRDREQADRMGEKGRARVAEELNWGVFTKRMLDALERRS